MKNDLKLRLFVFTSLVIFIIILLFVLKFFGVINYAWILGFTFFSFFNYIIITLLILRQDSVIKRQNMYEYIFYVVLIHGIYLIPFVISVYYQNIFEIKAVLLGCIISIIFNIVPIKYNFFKFKNRKEKIAC